MISLCQAEIGDCTCIPEMLIKQIQKKKKTINELDLQSSQIVHLRNLINLGSQLQYLYLSQNFITDITPIQQLKQLTYLDISGNHIKSLKPIFNLPQIRELRASFNQIEAVEKELEQMNRIEILNLSYNSLSRIEELALIVSKIRSLYSLNLKGNQFKNYTQAIYSQCENIQILDGVFIREGESLDIKEKNQIIILQEKQLGSQVESEGILTLWRKALYKQLIGNKSFRILVKSHLRSIHQVVHQKIEQQNDMIQKMNQRFNMDLNKLSVCVRKAMDRLKTQYQKKKLLLDKVSYQIGGITNTNQYLGESKEQVNQTLINNQIKAVKNVIDELKKNRQDLQLQNELMKQDQIYSREQQDELTQKIQQQRDENQRLEKQHRLQELEKNKIISQLQQENKQLQEELIKTQFQMKEKLNSEELQLYTIRQGYEQDIQRLQFEAEQSKLKAQSLNEDFKNRTLRQQQQFEERLKEQETQFNRIYEEVRLEYESKFDNKGKTEEKQNKEIMNLRQQIREMQLANENSESKFKQEIQYLIADKTITEKEFNKKIQSIIVQAEQSKNEIQQKQEEERKRELTQLTSQYEMEKKSLFQLIEEQHQEKLEEIQTSLEDQLKQKNHLSKQNIDLSKIIDLKDEMIKQLQQNLNEYRVNSKTLQTQSFKRQQREQVSLPKQSRDQEKEEIKETKPQNPFKDRIDFQRTDQLAKRAYELLNNDNDDT